MFSDFQQELYNLMVGWMHRITEDADMHGRMRRTGARHLIDSIGVKAGVRRGCQFPFRYLC